MCVSLHKSMQRFLDKNNFQVYILSSTEKHYSVDGKQGEPYCRERYNLYCSKELSSRYSHFWKFRNFNVFTPKKTNTITTLFSITAHTTTIAVKS